MIPLFSIIIPTLNEREFLPLLLSDIIKQRVKDFEVIVIDASSEDGTEKVARTFEKKLQLTVLNSPERNVSHQRNMGAEKAQGKYLLFLDADCRVSPIFISKLKKEVVKSHYLLYLFSINPLSDSYTDKVIFKLVNYGVEASQNLAKPLSNGGNCVIEKNFFLHIGGFNEKLFIAEDHAIVQYARNMGVRAKYIKDIKIKFSLRRVEKDGWFTLAYKYAISLLHTFFKGDIEEKIFEYDMGGARYNVKDKKNAQEDTLAQLFKQLKQPFKELVSSDSK